RLLPPPPLELLRGQPRGTLAQLLPQRGHAGTSLLELGGPLARRLLGTPLPLCERLPGSLQFPLGFGHGCQFAASPRLPFSLGGVPERSNGAVLKTAGGRKVARGFKSHPRRLVCRVQQSAQGPVGSRGAAGAHLAACAFRACTSTSCGPHSTLCGWLLPGPCSVALPNLA